MKHLFLIILTIGISIAGHANAGPNLDQEYLRRKSQHIGEEFSQLGQRLAQKYGITVKVPRSISAGAGDPVIFRSSSTNRLCDLSGYWSYTGSPTPIGGRYGKSKTAEVYIIEGHCKNNQGEYHRISERRIAPLFSCTDDVANVVMGDCE